MFRSRALVGGNLVLFALGMLAFGMPFILTQYAQGVLHYSPLEFGFASVVMPVTAAIGSITGPVPPGGIPAADYARWHRYIARDGRLRDGAGPISISRGR